MSSIAQQRKRINSKPIGKRQSQFNSKPIGKRQSQTIVRPQRRVPYNGPEQGLRTSLNLLKDFTTLQSKMFYVNTYNTFAYFSGQYVNDIDDGEVLRYIIFLELIINKLNRKSGERERELSELWNKSLGMKTFITNHDKILTRYRNIMESGFKSNGGNVSSILNNAKK